jgi:hypothetical protein
MYTTLREILSSYPYPGEAAKDGPCKATLAYIIGEMLSLVLAHYPVCFIAPITRHSRLFLLPLCSSNLQYRCVVDYGFRTAAETE